MKTPSNYENIERPYNQLLERTSNPYGDTGLRTTQSASNANPSSSSGSSGGSPAVAYGSNAGNGEGENNGSVENMPVKSGGALGDLWINTFIRSENWKPKNVGFYIDGRSGYAEFCNVFVSGNIKALTGSIGGFTIGATTLSVTSSSGNTTTISSGPIAFSAGPTGAPTVIITQAGSLTATVGAIGGWIIESTYIKDDLGVVGLASNATGEDDIRFWAGNRDPAIAPFRITESGALTASSGVIGGFSITSTSLYGGKMKTSQTAGDPGSNGVVMDGDGLRGYNDVLGVVFDLPTDGSAPTFSSGIINETIFEISTNAILRTSTTVGDGSAQSAGILINETGLYITEANQLLVDSNVKLLIDGTGIFNASVRGGQTDYNTGTGYFLGLSGGDYKLSIGNPAANYLNWDGTYLRVKGSFDVGSGGLINNSSYTVATLPVSPTTVGFNSPDEYDI